MVQYSFSFSLYFGFVGFCLIYSFRFFPAFSFSIIFLFLGFIFPLRSTRSDSVTVVREYNSSRSLLFCPPCSSTPSSFPAFLHCWSFFLSLSLLFRAPPGLSRSLFIIESFSCAPFLLCEVLFAFHPAPFLLVAERVWALGII
ncbi:hypothetical protein BJX99DRAFT_131668 [Aspergillus californicus]